MKREDGISWLMVVGLAGLAVMGWAAGYYEGAMISAVAAVIAGMTTAIRLGARAKSGPAGEVIVRVGIGAAITVGLLMLVIYLLANHEVLASRLAIALLAFFAFGTWLLWAKRHLGNGSHTERNR
jgi:hypothetical protein